MRGSILANLPWLAVAAAPVVFALVTWAGSQSHSLLNWWLRIFGLPVVVVELLFVVMAIAQGARPLGLLLQQSSWIKAALFGLALICLFDAATVSPRPLVAITWTLILVIHLLFGLAVAHLSQQLRHVEATQVWRFLVIGTCLYVAILATIYLTMADPARFDWEHLRLGTNNIRHTGHYAVVGVCVALPLSILQRGRSRFIYFAAACVCMTLAFWSGTRGAVVAIWAGLLVTMLFAPALRSWQALLQLGGVTVLASAFAWLLPVPHALLGIARIAESFQHTDFDRISSFRPELWSSAWKLVAERPLLGYGPGQFGWLLPANPYDVMHPHNVVLQSLVQWGVAGTILSGFLMVGLVGRFWAWRRSINASDAPAVLVAASFAIMALYDGTLFFTYPTAMFVFSLGWIFGRRSRQVPDDSN